MEQLTFRLCRKSDLNQVHGLVTDYNQSCGNATAVTFDDLEQNVFGGKEDSLVIVYVAETRQGNNRSIMRIFMCHTFPIDVVGYAMGCLMYSTWEGKGFDLRDFYLKPDFTQFGRDFLKVIIEYAKSAKCSRIDTHIHSHDAVRVQLFHNIVAAQNLTITENWLSYRLVKSSLARIINQ